MENQEQETVLKLSKNQLQNVINDHLLHENGLNEVFSMFVNGLMYSERQAFLDQKSPGNKGNGYRKATRAGIGSKLQLKIPTYVDTQIGICLQADRQDAHQQKVQRFLPEK